MTLVARVSRVVLTASLPDGHDLASTTDTVTAALKRQLRKVAKPSPGTKWHGGYVVAPYDNQYYQPPI